MSQLPHISVIIPCYNAERYIAATLDSVLAQDVPGIEIIVVDDGSLDCSVEVVRAGYPAVLLVQQANQGVASARNKGISVARGAWIAFVDADDIWLPGKLAAQLDAVRAEPACRMNYTAWEVWPSIQARPDAACLQQVQDSAADTARWGGASGWIYPQLLLDCVVWTSTVLVQRSLLEEIGGFDVSLRVGEDYDLWLRASRVTPIVRVARPYALYRIHPASITRSAPTDNYRGKVVLRALAQWGRSSPDGRQASKPAVQRVLAKSWTDFAAAHLDSGNLAGARRAGRLSLDADWGYLPAWKVLIKTYCRPLIGALAKAPK